MFLNNTIIYLNYQNDYEVYEFKKSHALKLLNILNRN